MSRVLLVEDYPPLAKVVAIGLQRLGHDVERAANLARAKECEGPFDLAVLDLELPDGDGVELAAWLFERERAQQVVFFTASRDVALRAAALEFGRIVDKDLGTERLTTAVGEVLAAVAQEHAVGDTGGARDTGAASVRKFSGLRRKVDG